MEICLRLITEKKKETTSSVTTIRDAKTTIEAAVETVTAARATMTAAAAARDLIART